jgi:hypothetical protein
MIYDDDGNPVLTDDDMTWSAPVEEVERERRVVILEPARRIEPGDLGRSPARIYAAAARLGWGPRAWLTLTRVSAVLFVHDSTQDAKNPHAAGDVRYEGYDARNYAIEARHPKTRLAFTAFWSGTSKDPSPTSASFSSARVLDPVGVPVENFYEYKAPATTRHKDETDASFRNRTRLAEEAAEEANAKYNDGSFRNERDHLFTQASPFDRWLDDWLELANLPTIGRKQRATKTEKNQAALIEGGEWNG